LADIDERLEESPWRGKMARVVDRTNLHGGVQRNELGGRLRTSRKQIARLIRE